MCSSSATASGRLMTLVLLACTMVAWSCSSFDPNAPYTLFGAETDESTSIPEGTPIVEHEPVPIAERDERIEVIEDLVLERGAEPFYRLSGVDSDSAGKIFVYDAGNQNIVTFTGAGEYERTIGGPGQGPGEINVGGDFAVSGAGVVHVYQNRINVWSSDGAAQVSRNVGFTPRLTGIHGTDDGRFVAFARGRRTESGYRQDVVAFDAEGYRGVTYADLPRMRQLMVAQGSRARSTGIPRPLPTFAVSRSGQVYVTTGLEYDVLALAPDGSPRWALRVPWPRTRVTGERIDQALAHVMGKDEDADIPSGLSNVRRSDVDWPEFMPALMGTSSAHIAMRTQPIQVDGHGHLYVLPFIPEAWDRPDQPVDVYSPDGEHLFSGMIPMFRWDSARGDHVYGVSTDPDTEENIAVRYRLVEPFDMP